jgi:lipoprotein-releasing system ATP-binding protein
MIWRSSGTNTLICFSVPLPVAGIHGTAECTIPALKLQRYSRKEVEERAYEKLQMLGMQDFALKRSNKLSGGQQQRVAIARESSTTLICYGDEPTGNLDSYNSQLVFDIFRELTRTYNQTIIAVTHDEEFA